jgi:hypothetical protein
MKFRIMWNGHKFKIQKKSLEGFFFVKEVWNDLGRLAPGGILLSKYYDSLDDAKKDFEKFVDYDNRLIEWTQVKL